MALQKTRNLKKSSIQITDAYCRIKALRFDHPSRVWVQVGVYESEEGELLDETEYEMTVEDFGGKELISASTAYVLLKAKDEWSDATDV